MSKETKTKNRGGRPCKFTPEQVAERCEKWLANGERTVTGLAIALGFTSRQMLNEYEAKPEFGDTIKKCRLMVENAYERLLPVTKGPGAIFALKNMGWKDRQEVDHSLQGEIKVVIGGDA